MSETVVPIPEQEARATYDRMLAETRKLDTEANRLLSEERKFAAEELLLRRKRRLTGNRPIFGILKASAGAAVLAAILTCILFGVLL